MSNTPINLNTSDMWLSIPTNTLPEWSYWDYTGEVWEVVDNSPPSGTPESQSATRIIANLSVTPATGHVSGVSDNANAAQNLADAANGLQAHTSCYDNAPCTMVSLSLSLLSGIETLANSFTLSISEIAGGSHTGQGHYNGNCMDVNWVNDIYVPDMTEAQVNAFRNAAFAAGASVVYDPYHDPYGGHANHFHIQW